MLNKKVKIGFIGTGIIGLPMAKNLSKNHYDVSAYSRNVKYHTKIVKNGIKVIRNLKEFFCKIDILILAVSDTKDVKEILTGPSGLVKNTLKPSIVIDMSTICPIETIKIANVLKKNNVSMIDAPVSGGEIGAINGSLSIMIGGEEITVKKVMPILKILGNKITYIGNSGSGQVAKACNQIIVAQTLNAVSEAFVIAEKFKVNKSNIRSALLGGFANSKVLDTHAKRILDNNFKPGFKTKLHAKDLRIVKNLANKKNLKLPGTNLVNKNMKKCNQDGHSEKDSSSYYYIVKKQNK